MLLHGVTGVLPALYFNLTREEYLRQFGKSTPPAARIFLGYYMEGPYLNPKFGCDRDNNP